MKKECRFCGEEMLGTEHQDKNHRWGVCIDNSTFLFEKNKKMEKLTVGDLIRRYNMNTLNEYEQSQAAYIKTADKILDILTEFGFLTESPFDETELKRKIIFAIQTNWYEKT